MPPTSRWLDEPPPQTRRAQWAAVAVAGLLLLLAVRACTVQDRPVDAWLTPEPVAADATATLAPLQLALATTPPGTPAAPTLTVAPTTPSCPPASPVPTGASVGWLARSSACPGLLYASVGGVRQWVTKPPDFPDALLQGLPELNP